MTLTIKNSQNVEIFNKTFNGSDYFITINNGTGPCFFIKSEVSIKDELLNNFIEGKDYNFSFQYGEAEHYFILTNVHFLEEKPHNGSLGIRFFGEEIQWN